MEGATERTGLIDADAIRFRVKRNSQYNKAFLALFLVGLTVSLVSLIGGYECYQYLTHEMQNLQDIIQTLNQTEVSKGVQRCRWQYVEISSWFNSPGFTWLLYCCILYSDAINLPKINLRL